MEGYILWAVPTSAWSPILYGRIRPMAGALPTGTDRCIARGCGIRVGYGQTHKARKAWPCSSRWAGSAESAVYEDRMLSAVMALGSLGT